MGTEVGIPEVYPQLLLIQKSMVMDGSPKLAHDNWVIKQSEDMDIGLLVQFLKSDKLKKYVARETEFSGIQILLKYRKDLFIKNGWLYQKVMLKNHSGPISQFVLPRNFVCKVILVCHDDNVYLGI